MNKDQYIEDLKAMNKQLLDQITQLTFELREMKRLLFGRSSERFIPQDSINSAQLDLALMMQEPAQVMPPVQAVVLVKKNASGHKPTGRQDIPDNIERVDIVLEPSANTTGLNKIGEEYTEQLDYVPGKIIVKRYIRPKYAHVSYDGTYTKVIIAPLPAFAIEKGMAAPGLLAQIIIDKHLDHLPIYRQIKRYQRMGISLSASTINGWMEAIGNLLEPLNNELKKQVFATDYLQADETPLPVLNGEKKGSTATGYLWAYHSPPDKLIFYEYQPGRAKTGPVELLKNYNGYLQTDGYVVYDHASIGGKSGIMLMHCMAHARRYFEKALQDETELAGYFLENVQKLYAIERTCREENYSSEQILAIRQQEAVPILTMLKQWMQEQYLKVLPKSPFAKAIAYALPRWEKLSIYTTDSRLQLDNNMIENAMRPVALGYAA